jgi:Cu/Ag efflux protein CusF
MMLKSLKPGDKIKFTAAQVDEDYVVTFIELAK